MEPEPQAGDLFDRIRNGDPIAADQLFQSVHDDLRRVAGKIARHEKGRTMHATVLVHEVWLRLFASGQRAYNDRSHFIRCAAKAMRQILIDYKRAKKARKRPQDADRVSFDILLEQFEERSGDLLALDAALERLRLAHPDLEQLIELRFFAGQTESECAQALGVVGRTIQRRWKIAQAYLKHELERND
ncbi:MAG: sigma-70 family RNA polymerase sigma factor [Planctomycetes bacterium]|nr:sigma-70 family RNA polymerase sigma factor [Planctomycetota bacterium]